MTSLLDRGVHHCPMLSSDGYPIIVSIDHNHREVQRHVLLPGENPYDVSAALWEHLDEVDPEYRRRGGMRFGGEGWARTPLIASMGMALYKIANMPFILD